MSVTFPEYESFDGLGLANLIQCGVLSSEEILNAAIERIELLNPQLNAVIYKMYDQARAALRSPQLSGPFKGVPILLKDLLADYEGTPICFGSRFAYDNHWVSPYDSELVRRLKQSGVLMLGKTNVPEFGLSPFTEPEVFGATRNPWDLSRSSGGSSGGSAAAVAARIVPIAHGGDGGGSLRIPAAYCGIFGFKPSRGRTPTGPRLMRVWLGMVVEHVLSRSVRDSAAMLDALCGPEVGSPIALPKPTHSFLSQIDKPPRRLRIALLEKPFFTAPVSPEYSLAAQQAAKLCQDLGHHVETTTLTLKNDVAFAFLNMMIAETSAGLKALVQAIGRKPKSNELEKTTAMLCHAGDEFSSADYACAIQILDQAARQVAEFYEKYDVILTPTMPLPAPKIGEFKLERNEQLVLNVLRYVPFGPTLRQFMQKGSATHFAFMAYTALFNIGGQPAMSVPLYSDKKGMPIGIQFAGKVGEDATLLQLARQLEEALPWAGRKPGLIIPSGRETVSQSASKIDM